MVLYDIAFVSNYFAFLHNDFGKTIYFVDYCNAVLSYGINYYCFQFLTNLIDWCLKEGCWLPT
ncbi:hypothetical protein RchiOBHm_Chr5g0036311 [Rosa chinensis]|uniref:Uncharacterized protein n=1 Tax=Rosa chinensis TaxID=74649 RepID=A0A2P6QBH2_ROSCH|nr:hypothetical protein RchiOBHm_Chr5g0036311 [Rosa chinensis]